MLDLRPDVLLELYILRPLLLHDVGVVDGFFEAVRDGESAETFGLVGICQVAREFGIDVFFEVWSCVEDADSAARVLDDVQRCKGEANGAGANYGDASTGNRH